MKAKHTYLLLGYSPFLNHLAEQVVATGSAYWYVQGADLPLYTFQVLPEQSRLLYAQSNSAESHAFLFYQLSQFFAKARHLTLFAETKAFFAAYLSRYLSADLYLRADLLHGLDALEIDWILATPGLKALLQARKNQQNQNLFVTSKTLDDADIGSDFILSLNTEAAASI